MICPFGGLRFSKITEYKLGCIPTKYTKCNILENRKRKNFLPIFMYLGT